MPSGAQTPRGICSFVIPLVPSLAPPLLLDGLDTQLFTGRPASPPPAPRRPGVAMPWAPGGWGVWPSLLPRCCPHGHCLRIARVLGLVFPPGGVMTRGPLSPKGEPRARDFSSA